MTPRDPKRFHYRKFPTQYTIYLSPGICLYWPHGVPCFFPQWLSFSSLANVSQLCKMLLLTIWFTFYLPLGTCLYFPWLLTPPSFFLFLHWPTFLSKTLRNSIKMLSLQFTICLFLGTCLYWPRGSIYPSSFLFCLHWQTLLWRTLFNSTRCYHHNATSIHPWKPVFIDPAVPLFVTVYYSEDNSWLYEMFPP